MTSTYVHVDITFANRPPMTLLISNGSATEVAERLAVVLGQTLPGTDIRLDLDPRSFHLKGTGYIEQANRSRVANIALRGAAEMRVAS